MPRRIIVRRPSPHLADGELTHLSRSPVDAGLAQHQWESYVDAFRARGWEVTEVPPADEHPDGVFVEDALVVFEDVAVLTSPGAPSRRGELTTMAEAARALQAEGVLSGVYEVERGQLDGGDVLKIGRTAYVGLSSRSDEEALSWLREVISPRGWAIESIPVTAALHLKSGVTALPDGTVIGYPPLVDAVSSYPRFLPVPEAHGAAVVELDHDVVLMSADAPETAELFRSRGLEVVTVSITEFEKLEGCVTCLSVRLRD